MARPLVSADNDVNFEKLVTQYLMLTDFWSMLGMSDKELCLTFADGSSDTSSLNSENTDTEVMSVDRLEWEHIQRVLNEQAGNISATARALNMHRRTLQRKLQKRPVRR